jgi:hypothetical protein
MHDVETGRAVQADRGSVCWNQYRRRWVTIAGGLPGEVWFAEADTPLGPWVYARRIVSHDDYNFYNPTQHSFFDQEGGRLIYFEGTYTDSFSGAKEKTPRYDYNQIMYRLSLDDPRLRLPAPVYVVRQPDNTTRRMMREDVDATGSWARIESVPFFAVPANRPCKGLIPIYAAAEDGATVLRNVPPPGQKNKPRPLFFGLAPTNAPASRERENERTLHSSAVVPVYEYRHRRDGTRLYSTQPNMAGDDLVRSPEVLCLVWRNPMAVLILDTMAKPVLTPAK